MPKISDQGFIVAVIVPYRRIIGITLANMRELWLSVKVLGHVVERVAVGRVISLYLHSSYIAFASFAFLWRLSNSPCLLKVMGL